MKLNFTQIKNGIVAVIFSVVLCNTAKAGDDPQNVIKLNLFALGAKSISLQYERVLTPKMSVCLGLNYITSRGLPKTLTNNDPSGILASLKISGLAITPEFRWYPFNKDKDAPKGFYIAPYFRYTGFGMKANVTYIDTMSGGSGKTYTYPLTVKFKGYGVGLMFGKQWLINDKVSIDWWILGGHYGSSSVSVGLNADFSNIDKDGLKKQLDDIKLPGGTVTTIVTNTEATVKVSGLPFGGIRSGLTIGYAF